MPAPHRAVRGGRVASARPWWPALPSLPACRSRLLARRREERKSPSKKRATISTITRMTPEIMSSSKTPRTSFWTSSFRRAFLDASEMVHACGLDGEGTRSKTCPKTPSAAQKKTPVRYPIPLATRGFSCPRRSGCWHVLTFHRIGIGQDGWEPITVAEFTRQMTELARHRDSRAVEVLTFHDGATRMRK